MSNKAINWAWKVPVNGNRKLVLIALADHVNKNDTCCWPGLDRLAQMCGISRSSVIHHVKELINLGIISKETRYDDAGHRTSNLYRLNFELSLELLRSKLLSSDLPVLSPDLPPTKSEICTLTIRNHKKNPKVKFASSSNVSSSVKNIFQYWQQVLNHPKAKLDRKRKTTIEKALQLGYSEDDLKTAIDGCANNPFNMGENNNNQKYDDINLIFRDAEHIERFIEHYKNPPKLQSADNDKQPWQGGI